MTPVEYGVLAFSSLFVIVDPIATVPAFLAMTARDTTAQWLRMARVACCVAVGILGGFALIGQWLFSLLGFSLPAVQVAGALLLLLVSLDMLRAQRSPVQEKAAETAEGQTDGGTTSRVFGTFITWLQEKTTPVFVIATANNVHQLPPELLRKGRFDEIFFVDFPTPEARQQIARIHLGKRGLDPAKFDVEGLARLSDGFSGAEIEQAIVASLYEAHALRQELATDLVLAEIRGTNPLSVVRAEEVAALREWAAERTVLAD